MNKKPLFISICNQKGGVGKTTYTILTASLLHYRMGCKVLVADCDYPQWSIAQHRQRDMDVMNGSDYFKLMMVRQFKSTGQKAWPILRTKVENAVRDVTAYIERETDQPDIVLFDMPGTIGTSGVLTQLSQMDHLFVPIRADRTVVESSISFARTLREGSSVRDAIHMFWTMTDGRERTPLYEHYQKILSTLDLPLMQSRIPQRSRFRCEMSVGSGICRSTLYPPESRFAAESHLDELVAEICSILKIG